MDYKTALIMLLDLGQSHLLQHWDTLTQEQKEHLLHQIQQLDIPTFKQQQKLLNSETLSEVPNLQPFDSFTISGNQMNRQKGQELISQGLVGCLIVAGGQGTRLGVDGPKGMCPVTAIRNKSLFQLFAEKVKAASKQAGRPLSLALMTSPLNHIMTVDFFDRHNYFGLDTNQVSFFSQEMLPLLNEGGQLFLEDPYTLAQGPNGNGGALDQFYHNGIWDKWSRQGIKYVNFVLIDNALADPFDAELIGYHKRAESDIMVKCVIRSDAKEKVGLLAKQHDSVIVVEYSEMPEEARSAKRSDGSLQYHCANLSLFCLNMDFIKQISDERPIPMPLHKAFKAAKYLNENGLTIKTEKPMAWKFEKFIFDIFPRASKIGALLYPREECFAPLKNFRGSDSLETVREALQKRDRHVLQEITGMACDAEKVEIDQEFYYPTPMLKQKWKGKAVHHTGYVEA